MKKSSSIFLFLFLISINLKSQTADIYINGVTWPGYTTACYGLPYVMTVTTSGGNPPYTCQWLSEGGNDTLGTSFTYSAQHGTYVFRLIKNGTAESEIDILIIEDDQLTVSLTPLEYGSGFNITQYGGNDGSIDAAIQGGASPYSYAWSNSSTSQDLDSITAGTYTLTVTDDHGCYKNESVTLTQPAQPLTITGISSPTHNGYNVSCKGCDDGAINITVAGGSPPYKYDWSNGNMDEDINTLRARQYKVIVYDHNGADTSGTITLTEPTELSVTLTPDTFHIGSNTYNQSCFDCNNGRITAGASGGVPGYQFIWSTGQTTSVISNLTPGLYAVMVTDTNGAKRKESIFLKAPDRTVWALTGNSNSDSSSNFIGTVDNKPLIFKTNNSERIKVEGNGDIKFKGFDFNIYQTPLIDSNGVFRQRPPWNNQYQQCAIPVDGWYRTQTGQYDIAHCTGKVGIGTYTPLDELHVVGAGRFTSTSNSLNYIKIQHNGYDGKIDKIGVGNLLINSTICINEDNQVGIDVIPDNSTSMVNEYSLFVLKGIMTEKVVVAVKGSTTWPDYVFNKDYKIKSLDEIKKFTALNKHLPDMPSASEIKSRGGINLGEIEIKSVKEIEEIYLHLIQLNERINELEKQNALLIERLKNK